jgi:hypothetical protein
MCKAQSEILKGTEHGPITIGPVLFAAAAVLEEKNRKEVQGTNLAGTGSGGIGTG